MRAGIGSGDGRKIVIEDELVRKALKRVNPNKAAGPDNVTRGFWRVVLINCSAFCAIFLMSLTLCDVPSPWKMSCIVPVPKKRVVTAINDLRPVVLTSCVMKTFERVVLLLLQTQVANLMDPLQFAYQKKRSIDDAILHVLNNIYSHLGKPGSSTRLMFYDFSSAFNTIQPHMHWQINA